MPCFFFHILGKIGQLVNFFRIGNQVSFSFNFYKEVLPLSCKIEVAVKLIFEFSYLLCRSLNEKPKLADIIYVQYRNYIVSDFKYGLALIMQNCSDEIIYFFLAKLQLRIGEHGDGILIVNSNRIPESP